MHGLRWTPTLVLSLLVLLAVPPAAAQTQGPRQRPPPPPLPLPAPKLSGTATDAEVANALGGWLERLTAADAFSGSVLVERKGTVVLRAAYGLADRSLGAANTVETLFNIGSINKVFTKIAIAQLEAAGKLSRKDTVAKWLPNLDIPSKDVITVEMLLSHRSGLGDTFGPRFEATPRDSIRTLAEYVALFAGQPLKFAPGTGQAYSNAGYVVLGLIIEKLTGGSYRDYLEARVWRPAGMTATDLFDADAVVPHRAVGYTREGKDAAWRSSILMQPGRGSSAGGAWTTADDLLRFAQALGGMRLLSQRDTARVMGAPPELLKQEHPPLGGFGAGGGSPGWNAALEIEAPLGVTIVVLANRDPPVAEQVARGIRGVLGLPIDD
jgi:CubicO group peptidase (beta-lactamase class C family)